MLSRKIIGIALVLSAILCGLNGCGSIPQDTAPAELVQKYQQELSDPIYFHAKDRRSALEAIYDGEKLLERAKQSS